MNTFNSDLLPPLFDQIISHYGDASAGPYERSNIVKAIENGIVNAAADSVRAPTLGHQNSSNQDHVALMTFDRLSGAHLSRAALIERLQRTVPLDTLLLEIALLLVEAQIDLRLKVGNPFKVSGIEFVNYLQSNDIATWCQSVLGATMRGATVDTATFWSRFGRRRPEGLRILVEGIQFSATLRDAVPYKIKVDKRLVEPLLAGPRQDRRIRLLHISDLHLVEDLTEPGRKMKRPLGAATHNFNIAEALERTVSGLKPAFDMVLATGDLTTDGDRGSFETLLQYIQSGPITGENWMRISSYGLQAGKRRRLLIPGNHDRFGGKLWPGQRLSGLFEDVLGTPESYPYVVGYRPPGMTDDSDSLTLLFFVFDSSLREGIESNDLKGLARRLSRGYIGKPEIRNAFVDQATRIVKNRTVTGLDGQALPFNPTNTIRIAALHHHPVVTVKADQERAHREQGLFYRLKHDPLGELHLFKKSIESSLMQMEGADDFLRGCFGAGIQFILFGHQHFAYRRLIVFKDGPVQNPFGETKAIHALCCPTTLEYSGPGNGFYVFDFFDKKTVFMDSYTSMRNGKRDPPPFTRDARTSCSFDLDSPSVEDLMAAYKVERPVGGAVHSG